MLWVDYYINDITINEHETYIEGNQVICNNLTCTFIERFDSLDDAQVIREIHEESSKGTP